MEPEVQIATPVETGAVPQNGASQETVPATQVAEPSQVTTPSTVETKVAQPTSPTETRKPSQFAQDRVRYRKEIDSLKSVVNQLNAKIGSLQTVKPTVPVKEEPKENVFSEEYIYKHGFEKAMKDQRAYYENQLKEMNSKIENRIPDVIQKIEKDKLLSIEDKKAVELAEKSGVPYDTVSQFILKNTHLQNMYEENPVETMTMVLSVLKNSVKVENGNSNGNGATKAQMSTVVSGKPASNGGMKTSLARITQDLKELESKYIENPSLRSDEKYNARVKQLTEEYEKALSANKT